MSAVGHDTLAANVIGEGNTCVGYKALLVNEASFITAVGFLALTANTMEYLMLPLVPMSYASIDGNANTAVGADALAANTGPGDSVALIGFGAGAAGVSGTAIYNW